jgi:hypothetical protein
VILLKTDSWYSALSIQESEETWSTGVWNFDGAWTLNGWVPPPPGQSVNWKCLLLGKIWLGIWRPNWIYYYVQWTGRCNQLYFRSIQKYHCCLVTNRRCAYVTTASVCLVICSFSSTLFFWKLIFYHIVSVGCKLYLIYYYTNLIYLSKRAKMTPYVVN